MFFSGRYEVCCQSNASRPSNSSHLGQYWFNIVSIAIELGSQAVPGQYSTQQQQRPMQGARSSHHTGFAPAATAVGFATASHARSAAAGPPAMVAPTTGQMRSGHIEVDSLYGGGGGPMVVNSMNAPNNSTLQCGCENIDCPFSNQMMSIQGGVKLQFDIQGDQSCCSQPPNIKTKVPF